jgi:hypothetical protein
MSSFIFIENKSSELYDHIIENVFRNVNMKKMGADVNKITGVGVPFRSLTPPPGLLET